MDVSDWEVVLAGLNREGTGTPDCTRERLDVGSLVRGDELKVQEEILVESGVEEVLQGECSEGTAVELILQMLECQSKLKNGDIDIAEATLAGLEIDRVGKRQASEEGAQSRESECLHIE